MTDYPHERLATTIHFPNSDQEWTIEGHIYLAPGTPFRWDDARTYTVERTLFVMEKHSRVGTEGLHIYLAE